MAHNSEYVLSMVKFWIISEGCFEGLVTANIIAKHLTQQSFHGSNGSNKKREFFHKKSNLLRWID